MNAIKTVENSGADVLLVTGTDANGKAIQARGWVSATTNHYPPSDYDAKGNLLPGSTPRAMTQAELIAYAQGLLDAANPPAPASPAVLYAA